MENVPPKHCETFMNNVQEQAPHFKSTSQSSEQK